MDGRKTHGMGRTESGFTLVELLVVIGIITVLISILLPVVTRAREAANRAVCGSNQRQIVLAIVAYANDNKQQLPGPCVASINDPLIVNPANGSTGVSLMTQWSSNDPYSTDRNLANVNLLQKYLGETNRVVLICPSARAMWEQATPANPSSEFAGRVLGYSYMVNNTSQTKSTYPAWLFGTYNRKERQPEQWAASPEDWTPKKLTQVLARVGPAGSRVETRESSKIWLITDLDGRNFGRDVSGAFGIVTNNGDSTTAKNLRPWQPVHRSGKIVPSDLGRNFGFLDGHVEYLTFYNWPNNDE